MSRSKTVVIAKLAYARPSAADAEYLPAKPGRLRQGFGAQVFAERHTMLRDDRPCSDESVALIFARHG